MQQPLAKSPGKQAACCPAFPGGPGESPGEWHILGHFQSTLAGLAPFLPSCLSQGFAAASGFPPGLGARQGAQTALDKGQSSLDATALQCVCRAWAGVRKQEAKHPTPFSLSLPGRGHTPTSSQNGHRGLGLPVFRSHFIVPLGPDDTVPCPSAALRFGEDAAAPEPPSQCPVSYPARLQGSCDSFAGSYGGDSQIAHFLLLGRCVEHTNCVEYTPRPPPPGIWVSGGILRGKRDIANHRPPAEVSPSRRSPHSQL